ncbi:MAG: metallophosphoesterase, partial [Clostridiales bacterium]|nr:metallophosphoesterase [Clostridiales bacterium]
RKNLLAQKRARIFPNAENNLVEAEKIAKEKGLLIAHTGDIIDFVSEKNIDAARKFSSDNDLFMSAGNHEFSLYVGEAKEDAAYREKSLFHVQSAFDNDIRFSSRIYHGVNFVALDNSYYLVEPWQLEKLREQAKRGYPIFLFVHTPLYSSETYDFSLSHHGGVPVYLMSVPEEKMSGYSKERYEQQKEDETTHKAYEFIMSEPSIKAVFCGHIHASFEAMLTDTLPQFIAGTDTARIVSVK